MLENLKKDVCEIAKRAQRDGLCKHKSGNFSARDVKSGYIVITPTSVDRELLTPRDMIVMDLEANVIENLSGLKPTSESLMHITIYKTDVYKRQVFLSTVLTLSCRLLSCFPRRFSLVIR